MNKQDIYRLIKFALDENANLISLVKEFIQELYKDETGKMLWILAEFEGDIEHLGDNSYCPSLQGLEFQYKRHLEREEKNHE